YWHDMIAYNYRMTNICAAIGLAQLEQADEILAKKRNIAEWYQNGLKNCPLTMHTEIEHTTHSYWMCSIAVDDPSLRQSLRDHLTASGIETRPIFHPAHTLPHCKQEGDFPEAIQLSQRGINLPSSPVLTENEVHTICESIQNFYAEKASAYSLPSKAQAELVGS
ncbi:MAG TPA: DegT/DnrJ/EryC1/StrS family aminotransferase, partial [Legionellaceae bacterium]|nr:DegT/DnrJ/EryC1/StrS family aminotransferase [Legionellaceae bacterium]